MKRLARYEAKMRPTLEVSSHETLGLSHSMTRVTGPESLDGTVATPSPANKDTDGELTGRYEKTQGARLQH